VLAEPVKELLEQLPSRLALEGEERAEAIIVLRSMSHDHRQVLYLRFGLDMSQRDASRALRRSVRQTRRIEQRALTVLEQRMSI
jgi:DNA-directed RNA polymerase specialized sigma24 family protein